MGHAPILLSGVLLLKLKTGYSTITVSKIEHGKYNVDAVQFCMYLLLDLLITNHFAPGVTGAECSVRHRLLCICPLTETVMILILVISFDLVHLVDVDYITVFCQLLFTVVSQINQHTHKEHGKYNVDVAIPCLLDALFSSH